MTKPSKKNKSRSGINKIMAEIWVCILCRNFKVSERKYSKKPNFEWTFSRTLSKSRKARITPKDAQFCQVHFSHRTLISTYTQFSKKRQKNFLFLLNVCNEAFLENCE